MRDLSFVLQIWLQSLAPSSSGRIFGYRWAQVKGKKSQPRVPDGRGTPDEGKRLAEQARVLQMGL